MRSGLEIMNGAATVIASAEFHHVSVSPPAVVQKRRWSISWSEYWCFGPLKNSKRIGHAVLVPEQTSLENGSGALSFENVTLQTSVRPLFVAPPSSPASFVPSDPPSSAPSPVGSVRLMYSPSGPHSMFAIGPYAYETQLVTPPVFSNLTTQPSTPPESVYITTPSSPEVPFAQFLHPIHRPGEVGLSFPSFQYDFQSYLLQPGSPVGPLISPGSAFSGSGTSSPFPDHDLPRGFPCFPDIRKRNEVPQKLLNLDVEPDTGSGNSDDNAAADGSERAGPIGEEGQWHQNHRAASLGSIMEFNFDHVNGINSSDKPCISSSWWANSSHTILTGSRSPST